MKKTIQKGSVVLDVGCGDGRNIKNFYKNCKKVIGIDNEPLAIKMARNKFKRIPNVKIILAEAKNLPFRKGVFDFVICMGNTFGNFLKDKLKILRERKGPLKGMEKLLLEFFLKKLYSKGPNLILGLVG